MHDGKILFLKLLVGGDDLFRDAGAKTYIRCIIHVHVY